MRLLVTGGPTREYLDRVRFISNPSTGLMGDALAEVARGRGHAVTLVRGPSPNDPPEGVKVVAVDTTEDMRRACLEAFAGVDAVIMAAAPCDYRPSERHPGKLKKLAVGEKVILTLVRTPDILYEMGMRRAPHQRLVGFAVEVDNPEKEALAKLERKRLDLVVLNDPSNFGQERGSARLFDRSGELEGIAGTKAEIAEVILRHLERILRETS